MTADQIHRIKMLYGEMPGAKMPPREDGRALWGEVEDTPEWRFCAEIVKMIDGSKSNN